MSVVSEYLDSLSESEDPLGLHIPLNASVGDRCGQRVYRLGQLYHLVLYTHVYEGGAQV